MAEANDIHGSIYQNLLDAGCDEQMTGQCMAFVEKGRFPDILPMLTRHRKMLLGTVYKGQRRIDCLDYLIYKVKNYSEKEI